MTTCKCRRTGIAALALLGAATPASAQGDPPWMDRATVARQAAARTTDAKYAVAEARARALVAAMTPDEKLQQMTGSLPEILPELPGCYGARHVSGIARLRIPTFRITNGPVGVGQNDCVSPSVQAEVAKGGDGRYLPYTHPSSAKATALPSAMAVAASFDPGVAATFGGVIADEMLALGLHVFEAPGLNMARLPILGRNFEYFGEDPFLTGTMGVAEIRAVQDRGLIAMAKHFIANEQETNRMTIHETIDQRTLREIYLLPFEMAVRDGQVAAIMCAYNYINTVQSCENRSLLTDVLRGDWSFRGYVQTDFFAMKSTAPTLRAGLDHEMPIPLLWAAPRLRAALAAGEIAQGDIDTALVRRFAQMFRAGIFDRPVTHTPIDFAKGGRAARAIGVRSAVLLQNNGALPLAASAKRLVLVGKATQPYAQQAIAGGAILGKPMGAGGGSSDVVPAYSVAPADGIRAAMGNGASLSVILVDDANSAATIDGRSVPFAQALATMAAADAVIVMAGTIAEEGADRATFTAADGRTLAAPAAAGSSLDWYAARSNAIATTRGDNVAKSSGTVAMLGAILRTRSTTARAMAAKTVLVLKDNAGVAIDPMLVGPDGPSILEVWFPGQEDGNIVADLLFGRADPSGRLPVTFPLAGRGFLDSVSTAQFPGAAVGDRQTVTYREQLAIGYRWYDANAGGGCAVAAGVNPCVAFPFGHGLSYTDFTLRGARLIADAARGRYRVEATVTNVGKRRGAQTVQAYVTLPERPGASQPPRRLVGVSRIDLAPGASAPVAILVDAAASNHPLEVWSEAARRWIMPPGRYTIRIGTSSSLADLAVAGSFDRRR